MARGVREATPRADGGAGGRVRAGWGDRMWHVTGGPAWAAEGDNRKGLRMNEVEKRGGWLNYRDLCAELSISRPTAERLVAQGLPHLKIGRLVRFSLPRVLAWLEGRTGR